MRVYLWHGKERSPAHSVTSVNMHCFRSVFRWVRTLSGCDGLWNSEMFMEPVLVRDLRFSWTVTDMAAAYGPARSLALPSGDGQEEAAERPVSWHHHTWEAERIDTQRELHPVPL